jgi:uncharacterized surface protein with fasciclin (FAS1) repeats
MKTTYFIVFLICQACSTDKQNDQIDNGGLSTVKDDKSQLNVVQVAMASPDHTTFVKALKAADYADVLSSPGPFTVFIPTDEAFGKLPKGALKNLLKSKNKTKLRIILEYHVHTGRIRESMIHDGMALSQVNGKNVILTKNRKETHVNEATIIGTVQTSNGIIYVIDQVLIPD